MSQASSSVASGRAASILRRQALSAGKAALPPSAERSQGAPRRPAPPQLIQAPLAVAIAAGQDESPRVVKAQGDTHGAACGCAEASCRGQAKARRAAMSRHGRGDAPPARPSRPPRQGRLEYAPKVAISLTQGAQKVSGLHSGRGNHVTGTDSGATLPVSGTQYIGVDAGSAWSPAAVKVGHTRTPGGSVVSGTMVRSRVAVTGDEAGNGMRITGEADQQLQDDLSRPRPDVGLGFAQFRRQADPHGRTLFGASAARVPSTPGSRDRERGAVFESTESGLAITGTVLDRSSRVTGDEDGACRHLTGDQYLTPARRQSDCGGRGAGTAPVAMSWAGRLDPASGSKVSIAQTWKGQRVSGCDFEHNPRVTGDEPGSCSVLTGTPYQGPKTVEGWCDPAVADEGHQRLGHALAPAMVTGDVPLRVERVSGTHRGGDQDITGTPYYTDLANAVEPAGLDVASIDQRFSVGSPQRSAHLRPRPESIASGESRITGAFAVGQGKITGNLEFLFKRRGQQAGDAKPGHTKLTGEGSSAGRTVTGSAWGPNARVTGTEGQWAAGRSLSEGGGKPHAFAGSARFAALEKPSEPQRMVTGMVGWSSKSAAKVTLSGGAHG